MARYVVLLRGVNVGGHNKVPMVQFRALLESLGHTHVTTYVQSGNAVFTSGKRGVAGLAREIETSLVEQIDVDVHALVLSRDRLVQIRDANPFIELDDDPTHQVVAFLSGKPPAAAVRELDDGSLDPERFQVVGDVIYLHYPNGQGRSKLDFAKTFRGLGGWSTARNWRTVNKLIELADAP